MNTVTDKLPKSYLASMQELLGEEYEAYLNSFEEEYYKGIRVNTAKISVEDFLQIAPFSLKPIPWTENGFYVEREEEISKHPYYYAGLYYIQEPSAMVPASRLPVAKGDRILDLCAAPGGKSTELSSRLQGEGCLIANDISNSRAKALLKNLELFGGRNFCVCSEAPQKLASLYPEFFDKILIDAPCSGEGMFRKDNSMLKSYAEHGPAYYASIQKEILGRAHQMLKPGGYLLYSTCTFSRIENEENILDFLKTYPDMYLAEMDDYPAFKEGKTSKEEEDAYHISRCRRLFPHKLHGEGHFVALLKKEGEENQKVRRSVKKEKLSPQWEEFQKSVLKNSPLEGSYRQVGDALYLIGDQDAVKKQIRYLRTGLYLGECRNKRFEPSQALAMALSKEEVINVLNLTATDERTVRYLKGETIDLAETEQVKKGWILICVDGYSLGWGKVIDGSIRNKYYSGWRMN